MHLKTDKGDCQNGKRKYKILSGSDKLLDCSKLYISELTEYELFQWGKEKLYPTFKVDKLSIKEI